MESEREVFGLRREDQRRRRRKEGRRLRQGEYMGGECRNKGVMWDPQMDPDEVPAKMGFGGQILRRNVERWMHIGM